ncbi:MAG TPA: type II secretion system protein GspD, partial [Rudaea sp.]|nr:type II secretion system protein GspD [Rudaea sp.]
KILEVTLSGDLEFGVQWWLAGLINNTTSTNNSATGYNYGPGFQGNAGDRHRAAIGGTGGLPPTSGQGFFYSFLNKNFQVALDTLQTSGQTKILSAPSLVVMNNQQAQITVGTQVPIISQSIIGVGVTSDTNSLTNTGIGQASYISTGVTLQITPRVNPGGLVYMDVSQEDSVPGAAVGNNPNPPISQRNLQTEVAVQSGQTVLLGGIIQDHTSDSKTGVPLLSSIPLLGSLFGNTSKTHDRTELIVLITPRVIVSSEDAREMTEEYEKKFESLTPIKTSAPPPATVAQPIAVPEPAPITPPTPLPEPQLPNNLKDRPNGN